MKIDFSPRFERIPAMAIGGIAQGIGGIISGITGLSQKSQGKKLLRKIGDETIPEDVLRNQRMAQTMSNEGLPSEQYANAMKNIQSEQLAALRGAQDRRGGLAAISSIQQAGNDANLNLDVADANARRVNKQQLMNVNNQVGNWKNRIWERKYNYGQSLIGAGNQNLTGGHDKIAGGASMLGYRLFGGGGRGVKAGGNKGYNDPNNPYVSGYATDFDEYGN